MRLRYSPASPFVRKVLVCAHEKGLAETIELVPTMPTTDSTLGQENPLRLIPTLITDEGEALFDSPAIVDYLEILAPQPALIPMSPGSRMLAMRQQAVGDGIADAAVARRGESVRPAGEQSPGHLAKLKGRVDAALDWLEAHIEELGQEPDVGRIAVGCALGYLDLRFASEDWRKGRPHLAAWAAAFDDRPSMQATRLSVP
ncbi:MAG TPA: glutathione S-transferase N-terminal domain-containing protein [Geminicoccaceae bacterium]|nr:glutathione S-transferase N-terminal domain-containing protein [Geminicoccus sp.]HMU48570.1 glutathione S-transferase N-terminal domain-containing protein [Geminicoccaceae bacterium]